MSVDVITNGDIGTPVATITADVVFVPPTKTISVTSGTELGIDGNAVALESDIDGSLSGYVSMAGLGTDASVGTSTFHSITGITTSTVLEKGGTVVVLKATVSFQMNVAVTWIIPPSTPSVIYVVNYKIPCTMSWITVQNKLRA